MPLAIFPDGRQIATDAHGNPEIIRIFRLRDKREIQTIETQSPGVTALAFTPDGRQVAAGLLDTSIVLWNVQPAG